MKVVFLEDVDGVAQGGEIKEVKNGFARNYLIPKNLATPATHNNIQRVTKLGKEADVNRIQHLDDMKELAEALDGTQLNIEMRAGANNRLYGSVTGTMVADAVAEETGRSIERRLVQLDNPIREVGTYQVPVRLHTEVSAIISVVVYATGTDPLAEDEEVTESISEEAEVSVAGDAQAVVDSTRSDESIQEGYSTDSYTEPDEGVTSERDGSSEDSVKEAAGERASSELDKDSDKDEN
ncbi:MAG: 50S ribosomal protein L9 [Chloroflexota bacterium]|nr:50S ribosomal protein L9 [Chloroflexota bacterium]